jgi:ATP-dependent Clp endopeptidase proteolytic subunit ClpP
MRTWFTITNLATAPCAEIDIFDEIGLFGVTVKNFADALKSVPADRDITLRINSPGGSIFDGFAIYNLLAERRDKVTAKIIGLAASMASVIALAGKRTVASENATIMIHRPNGGAYGESKDMREMADLLDKLEGALVNVYVTKSGKSEAEVKSAMSAITWFTAQEAKAWGLVDEINAPVRVSVSFDLNRFGNVPDKISGGHEAPTNQTSTPQVMKNLLKALVEAKLIASADATEDVAVSQLTAALASQAVANKELTDKLTASENSMKAVNDKLSAAIKAEAEGAVSAAVAAKKIKDDKDLRAKWVESYIRDAAGTKSMIDSMPEASAPRGVAPVGAFKPTPTQASELTGCARIAAAFNKSITL